VGRRTLLVMTVVAAVVLAACGHEDGGPASREGAVTTIQTVAPLDPLVRELVDAYRTADANIELAVVPADQIDIRYAPATGDADDASFEGSGVG
jgi:ABC-type glycerol-3-phosphate transport system substrate-binding protein